MTENITNVGIERCFSLYLPMLRTNHRSDITLVAAFKSDGCDIANGLEIKNWSTMTLVGSTQGYSIRLLPKTYIGDTRY